MGIFASTLENKIRLHYVLDRPEKQNEINKVKFNKD